MIYQEQFGGVTITKCGPGISWRMVHDGTRVIAMPLESDGITGTRYTLFEADSEAACLAEIARLGLVVPEDEVPDVG